MIVAVASGRRDGRDVDALIVGLSDENLHRLREGLPIRVDGRAVDMPERDLVILYGRDEASIEAAIASDARAAGVEVERAVPAPPEGRERDELLHFVLAGAERLGLLVARPPHARDDGTVECACCGEPIQEEERNYWMHAGPEGVHGCRRGEGCAHPLVTEAVLPEPPTKEGTQ